MYEAEIAAAQEMIREAGGALRLVSFDAARGSQPEKPWATTCAPSLEQDAVGVFLPVTERRGTDTLSHTATHDVLVAAAGLEAAPQVKGEVRSGEDFEVRWRIESVETLAPAGTPILYTLRVAR